MPRTSQVSDVLFGFALSLMALGGSGCSSTKNAAPAKAAGPECSADWKAECALQKCDATDPGWTDCKINGWTGYVPPPHCAATSGLPGDDQALCAPDPDEGIQLHFGPSNYDDPAEVQKYMLDPGGESYDCTFAMTPNETGKYFGQYIARSRPGAHHLQMTFAATGDTTPAGTTRACNLVRDLIETAGTFIAIAQSGTLDVPDLSTPRSANTTSDAGGLDFEGSAAPMTPNQSLQLLSHFLNTTNDPILKEGWFNFYYRDAADVTSTLYTISLLGSGINVPAHGTETFRRACATTVDRDVKYLQGHSHVGDQRLSIWHAAAGGSEDKVYENYDPLEPVNLAFNPFVQNPAPDPTAHTPGGASGPLTLKAGDSIVWECQFDNQTNSLVTDGDPNPKAFGQMCYTYGSYAVPLDQPAPVDPTTGQPIGNWACGASTPTTL